MFTGKPSGSTTYNPVRFQVLNSLWPKLAPRKKVSGKAAHSPIEWLSLCLMKHIHLPHPEPTTFLHSPHLCLKLSRLCPSSSSLLIFSSLPRLSSSPSAFSVTFARIIYAGTRRKTRRERRESGSRGAAGFSRGVTIVSSMAFVCTPVV
jgi:hypothetical protein